MIVCTRSKSRAGSRDEPQAPDNFQRDLLSQPRGARSRSTTPCTCFVSKQIYTVVPSAFKVPESSRAGNRRVQEGPREDDEDDEDVPEEDDERGGQARSARM